MQGTTYSGKMRSPAALVPEGRKSLSVAFRRKNIIRQRKKKRKTGRRSTLLYLISQIVVCDLKGNGF